MTQEAEAVPARAQNRAEGAAPGPAKTRWAAMTPPPATVLRAPIPARALGAVANRAVARTPAAAPA